MSPSTTSKVTTDHQEIRRWAEERGAKPAAVIRTESGDDPGIIRLDFPGYSGAGSLEEIGWDEWFKKFDQRKLALLYQEETAGGQKSNFNKIISRETAEEVNGAVGGRGRSASHRTTGARAKSAAASRSRGAARNSTRAEGRRQTTKRSTSTRGRASSSNRASTRSRAGEKRANRGGATRGSTARTSRTTSRGGSRTGSPRSSGSSGRRSQSRSQSRAQSSRSRKSGSRSR
jgi:hypothetical protein